MILWILDPIVGKIILLPTALQWELWKDVDASFVFPPIAYAFSGTKLNAFFKQKKATFYLLSQINQEKSPHFIKSHRVVLFNHGCSFKWSFQMPIIVILKFLIHMIILLHSQAKLWNICFYRQLPILLRIKKSSKGITNLLHKIYKFRNDMINTMSIK